jgi:hypothetical protein
MAKKQRSKRATDSASHDASSTTPVPPTADVPLYIRGAVGLAIYLAVTTALGAWDTKQDKPVLTSKAVDRILSFHTMIHVRLLRHTAP